MKIAAAAFLTAIALAAPCAADTVTLVADRDATLFEQAEGLLASGAGPHLFFGRTGQAQDSRRRALVRFDLAPLPRGAVIDSARLILHVNQANPGSPLVAVHRVLADWGEGASVATGGGGAPALPGDATWIHRVLEPLPPAPPGSPQSARSLWTTPGGDYQPLASAATPVPGIGDVVFTSPELAADVAHWLRRPRQNFGWILVGGEDQANSARRADSRHGMLPAFFPRLEVTYHRK